MYSDVPAGRDSGAPRRLLGMKTWQAVLLAAMAVMDCLVIVVGAAVVLGPLLAGGGGTSAASLSATQTAEGAAPSLTPITMVFQFATFTPFGTPAVSPTPTRGDWMEGWVQVSVPAAEMWMPASYAAGDPHTGADAIIAALQDKGANYTWDFLREQMTGVEENYVMWGIDSHQGNPAVITNLAVIYNRLLSGESLSEYADRFLSENAEAFVLIAREPFAHPAYEAERLILSAVGVEDVPRRFVLYAIRDGDLAWNIFGVTSMEEFPDRLSEFDRMAGSFRVRTALE